MAESGKARFLKMTGSWKKPDFARWVLGVLFAGLLLAFPGMMNAARGGERLVPSSELRQMFPGRFQARVKGYEVRFIASRNGRLKGYYGRFSDTGRWSLRGNRLCIMLKDWLDGKTTCAPVRRIGGAWYAVRGIRFRRM